MPKHVTGEQRNEDKTVLCAGVWDGDHIGMKFKQRDAQGCSVTQTLLYQAQVYTSTLSPYLAFHSDPHNVFTL